MNNVNQEGLEKLVREELELISDDYERMRENLH